MEGASCQFFIGKPVILYPIDLSVSSPTLLKYHHNPNSPIWVSQLTSTTLDAATANVRAFYNLGPHVPVQLQRETTGSLTSIVGDEDFSTYLNQGDVFKVEFDGKLKCSM